VRFARAFAFSAVRSPFLNPSLVVGSKNARTRAKENEKNRGETKRLLQGKNLGGEIETGERGMIEQIGNNPENKGEPNGKRRVLRGGLGG